MGRADPFVGYSLLLRTMIFVVVPAFTAWQFVRLRRAAHVFQLESYKRHWFTRWCREDARRALFLGPLRAEKKPLVMTGRVWRMVVTGSALTALLLLVPAGLVHITWGTPFDLIVFALLLGLLFVGVARLLLVSDAVMTPVQNVINGRYLRAARSKLAAVDPLVVGVTGSYGKTSTKFAIEGLLGRGDAVLATPGSFNTPLGVSRTINESLGPAHRYFIVEMGARQPGDIAEICDLVRHRIGVLTAVGPAHLESFGSLEAIERTKAEIVERLPSDGVAVLNVDDPIVRKVADRAAAAGRSVIRYGIEEEGRPDVTMRDLLVVEDGTASTIADTRDGTTLAVRSALLGRHALGNLLAAVGVALAAGLRLEDLKDPIEALQPVEHRLQVIKGEGGVTVIDDAYNSNPSGAAAALEVLERMPGRRKIVVTPGMVELGPLQAEANEAFGAHAGRVADTVIVVARLNRDALVRGARSAGRADVIAVDSLQEATERMKGLLAAGDVVLFENDLPDQYEG
ncbi:MAG TPA: UDP-N-acetylmuramoyl-tripeptide--D-alanyl-D-alanine ligase [Actinomycetota bacterium]|nr:UDP-N-acetylmuramoyl-tripeptide--D-alanyl-D-alanine ligase [Actinomycetota bacterium]